MDNIMSEINVKSSLGCSPPIPTSNKIEKNILNPFFPLLLVHYDHWFLTLISGV